MPKRTISLSLQLTEKDGTVVLTVQDGGKVVVDFEDSEAPPVRVNGFAKRAPNFQTIIDLLNREGPTRLGGASEVLDIYIQSLERQIYKRSLELRSQARHLTLLGGALRTAKTFAKVSRVK